MPKICINFKKPKTEIIFKILLHIVYIILTLINMIGTLNFPLRFSEENN